MKHGLRAKFFIPYKKHFKRRNTLFYICSIYLYCINVFFNSYEEKVKKNILN